MQRKGFTLIELMVTVAVVGILAAIAYPSYIEYLQKGRRVDAKLALMDAAQAMERYYTDHNSYASAAAGTDFSTSSSNGNYTLSFATDYPTENTYLIKATPTGAQSGDKCGTYTLNQLGQKGNTDNTLLASACW